MEKKDNSELSKVTIHKKDNGEFIIVNKKRKNKLTKEEIKLRNKLKKKLKK